MHGLIDYLLLVRNLRKFGNQLKINNCKSQSIRMKYLLFLFMLCASVSSCRKIKVEKGSKRLPRETERGKRIFACHIDDNTYIARYQNRAVYNSDNNYLHIYSENRAFKFSLFIYDGFKGVGEYKLSITGEELYYHSGKFYGVKTNGLNCLNVTKFDLEEDVISGIFQLDLYNSDSTEIKKIRNGRFDLEIWEL